MAISSLIEIGRRALAVHQTRLNTTGQNIANVETEGYSRREVNLTTAPTIQTPVGQIGHGVDAASIQRVRDEFIDRALLHERHLNGTYEEQSKALKRIEQIVNEPSDAGLNHALTELFISFHNLANDPENTGVRTAVIGAAQNTAGVMQRIDRQFADLRSQLADTLDADVRKINELTTQIADLNRAIAGVESISGEASAERDRRDMLVDELGAYMAIQVSEMDGGHVSVSIGEMALVSQDQAITLQARIAQIGDVTTADIVRADTDQALNLGSGRLNGILYVRDTILADYQQQLDDIADTLVREVNAVHKAGYGLDGGTDRVLFNEETTGASDIAVDEDLVRDPERLAASLDGATGDNRNALALRNIEDLQVLGNGTMTMTESYQSLIGDLGARSRSATAAAETQDLIVEKLENDRASVSGVSLDEEAAGLITQQRAYQAAARLVRTADEMTEVLLGMLR